MKTKFFTGKGDKGKSEILGAKVSKSSLYTELLGTLDELNAWVGLCRVGSEEGFITSTLKDIQETLFIAQAEIASFGMGKRASKRVSEEKIKTLESAIDSVDKEVPAIHHFVIPGGTAESAQLDIARTVARRAERIAVAFSRKKKLSPELMAFLNRLSSALFALARYVNYKQGVKEEEPSYGCK